VSGVVRLTALVAVVATIAIWSTAPPARAFSPGATLCSLTGLVSTALGKGCTLATHAGRVLDAGKKLLGGHLGGAVKALGGSGVKKAGAALGLAAIAASVVGGARYALQKTANVIGTTTRPNLESTWFSSIYWRMAAVSALLTLPFLFAAAVQAMIRSDLAMLGRAAFGYLPLAMLAVAVAAPMATLLLSGSDEMSAIVSATAGHAGGDFLDRASGLAAGLSLTGAGLFVSFFLALLTVAATVTLWLELTIRQAAVYLIVLMLPLFFAAMVWPARRIWAIRAVELLVSLILSKFAIVAALALGGAALGHTTFPGPAAFATGTTLVLLATLSPWALMRLLPLHEVAGAAAGGLRSHGGHGPISSGQRSDAATDGAERIASEVPPRLDAMTRRGFGDADWSSDDALSAAGSAAPGNAPGSVVAIGTRALGPGDSADDHEPPSDPGPNGGGGRPAGGGGDEGRGDGVRGDGAGDGGDGGGGGRRILTAADLRLDPNRTHALDEGRSGSEPPPEAPRPPELPAPPELAPTPEPAPPPEPSRPPESGPAPATEPAPPADEEAER
jgi:hypothetical protein